MWDVERYGGEKITIHARNITVKQGNYKNINLSK